MVFKLKFYHSKIKYLILKKFQKKKNNVNYIVMLQIQACKEA